MGKRFIGGNDCEGQRGQSWSSLARSVYASGIVVIEPRSHDTLKDPRECFYFIYFKIKTKKIDVIITDMIIPA